MVMTLQNNGKVLCPLHLRCIFVGDRTWNGFKGQNTLWKTKDENLTRLNKEEQNQLYTCHRLVKNVF